ncbi:hypothetical protein Ancab_018668 [Ancistrocladus abbreviatus]
MKIDNDPGFRLSSPPRKSYNPFDSDDDTLETSGLKAVNGFRKDSYNDFDLRAFQSEGDRLSFHMNNGDFSWDEAIPGHSTVVDNAINADVNIDKSLFGKETEFYTDKNVTEYDLPEFIVCYKEGTYQSVKDIGIDEGVPSQDKMWVKNREDYSKDLSASLDFGSINNGDFDIRTMDHELPILEGLKSSRENDCQNDAAIHGSHEVQVKMDGLNIEALGRQDSAPQPGTADSVKVSEVTDDSAGRERAAETKTGEFGCHVGSSNSSEKDASCSCESHMSEDELNLDVAMIDGDASEESVVDNIPSGQNLASEESTLNPSILDGVEAEIKSAENPNEGARLPPSELSDLELVADSSDTNGLSYNSKVESGTIAFSFNSSDTGKEEEKTQNAECEKPPQSQTMTRQQGSFSGNMNSSLDQRVHEESSFPAGVTPPSLITYSGPIAYSGSISLRSESSAGSARSFAFPVLQTEWNNSPVRMAKADRRHFRKQKGWVQSLICCRF